MYRLFHSNDEDKDDKDEEDVLPFGEAYFYSFPYRTIRNNIVFLHSGSSTSAKILFLNARVQPDSIILLAMFDLKQPSF